MNVATGRSNIFQRKVTSINMWAAQIVLDHDKNQKG